MAHHPHYPEALRDAGWPVGDGIGAPPGFQDGAGMGFALAPGAPARGAGRARLIRLPRRARWRLPAGLDLGAWQGGSLIEAPAVAYG